MPSSPSSYLNDKCEVRSAFGTQMGVYARDEIKKDEVIAIFGGLLRSGTALAEVPKEIAHLVLQIEEDVYLVPTEAGPAHRMNHSCDPNCGFAGQIVIVAMRDIAADEHLTFDYAMCDGTPYDEFVCMCGSALCRHHITGTDWGRPELHARYAGYFSPYLQRRIGNIPSGHK